MSLFQNRRLYKAVLVVVALALLTSVHFSQRHLNRERATLGLTRLTPLENAPPVLAFTTIALGGFRGLIANALWIRASDLQESDKYFEMVQLADWITKLQPHFTTVWVHQAWNMSYNISIKFTDMAERWNWVLRGIELLRDGGLRYNPKSALMYRELAWHFQHKMGQSLDDGHDYYKFVWAEQMQKVLLGGRPNFGELVNPQTDEARARVALLTNKYKMNPQRMKEVDERYGPLEWRLPETHAIYWAYVGMQECRDGKPEDLVQLRRNIFQSMQTAYHRGRMIFPKKGVFEFTYGPNVDITDKVSAAYEEMIEKEPNLKDNLRNGHKNFLKTAVGFLFTHNRIKAADFWFKYLQEKYPDAVLNSEQIALKNQNPNMTFPPKSLEEYAIERVTEEANDSGVDRTKAVVEGYLKNAYIALAIGEDERAAGFERYAQLIHRNYQNRMGEAAIKRVGLPEMALLKKEAREAVLDPEQGYLDEAGIAQLRTVLGLAAASAPTAGSSSTAPNPTPTAAAAANVPAEQASDKNKSP